MADGKCGLHVWRVADENPSRLVRDDELAVKLNAKPFVGVAASEEILFGFDERSAWQWSPRGWTSLGTAQAPSRCRAFAVVQNQPFAVCGNGVFSFGTGQYFEPPRNPIFIDSVDDRLGDNVVLAAHDNLVPVGTGFGEWGGFFFVLNTSTGRWSKTQDEVSNAVWVVWWQNQWAVAWSMSHLGFAHTRIRLHATDALPAKEGQQLDSMYVRALAVDARTHSLWAVEQESLTQVDEKMLSLDSRQESVVAVPYGAERLAVGVSSGVAGFISIGQSQLVVMSNEGELQLIPLRL